MKQNMGIPSPSPSLNIILPVSTGDNRIGLTSNRRIIIGIYLQYKPEITMNEEYSSTTADVKEDRIYPFKRLKHLKSDSDKVRSSLIGPQTQFTLLALKI